MADFRVRYNESDFRRSLILALRAYSYELAGIYKQKLILGDVNATGKLITSIVPYSGELSPKDYVSGLRLESYWRYVEFGRQPGKFPPPNAIKNWILVRNIVPTPYVLPSGKLVTPTIDQLTYLISRKIAIEGIQERPFLQESINELTSDLNNIVENIVGEAITDINLSIGTVLIK